MREPSIRQGFVYRQRYAMVYVAASLVMATVVQLVAKGGF